MAQPVWITSAGSLGTIPEGQFFQVPIYAYDPDDPDNPDAVKYEVIAGKLPPGIQCEASGLIVGVPKAIISVQGVPLPVSEDVTYQFAARVYTENPDGSINRLNDRTFSLTITGQDIPEFITPAGRIDTYFDGTLVTDLEVSYADVDPFDVVIVRLKSGSLPTGLTISETGVISGVIEPLPATDPLTGLPLTSQEFEFTLELTDGKARTLRTFNILVYRRGAMTSDNTDVTADDSFITADVTSTMPPIIVSPAVGTIGPVRNDNFFAIQFVGRDFQGFELKYELGFDPGDSTLLPGLTLDPVSGWLYGYIPNLGVTENTYEFYIRTYRAADESVISEEYNYTLDIVGPVDTDVTWLTDSDLGTIVNGSTSTLYVEAVTASGTPLQYQLKNGSDSLLPQGLQLLPSGDIAGRCSFNTFALDGGETTFDVTTNDLSIANENTETTFDLKFTFVVNAYSSNGLINVNKTFYVTVDRVYNKPYENLYIEAMPPQDDRNLIDSLLQNADIFQPELLYRPADPNFGRATGVIYNHAFGLTSATYADYVSGLYENHYWKELTLGEIKVAQARNSTGTVIYEVVYSEVRDNLLNNQGQSVSKQIALPYPIDLDDGSQVDTVYPNSLINMRDQIIDTVGQVANILPSWMISKQSNGRVLGFTPAWVICYAKPGKGEQIAYYIRTKFGERLNQVDFEVDRYELDRLLTKNWDPTYDSWIPSPPQSTSFDINWHYQSPDPNGGSFVGGSGYSIGDQIIIDGNQIGGQDDLNDVVIRVNAVDDSGTITGIFATGTAPLLTTGNTYTDVAGTNLVGSGAIFRIVKYASEYSISITAGGTNYYLPTTIVIPGSDLDGVNGINDATITVLNVSATGAITHVSVVGNATIGAEVFDNVNAVQTTGSGALFDLEVVDGDQTTFDGGSMQFIDPVDMYSNTQEYDKYLVFPKRTILG
jgi:hypothetical protein